MALMLVLAAGAAGAAEQAVMTLDDPAGDDVGDGTLLYPTDGTLQPGDLDLRSLKISRDENGYWFNASFGNFIRENWWSPLGEDNGVYDKHGQHQLRFSFNLDIYIDTDRKPGSGNLFTLPGRKVRIDRRYAWERAVLLSPRPKTVRSRLLQKLKENFPGRPAQEAEASIDSTMFFTDRRKISDRSISFFVPRSFMGESNPKDWAVTAFVTMASPVVDDKDLGVLQVAKQPSSNTLGHTGTLPPPPLVDLLAPTAARQFRILSSAEALTAYSGDDTGEEESGPSYTRESFKSRLQSLKELHDRKVIDDATYQAQRRKLLGEL